MILIEAGLGHGPGHDGIGGMCLQTFGIWTHTIYIIYIYIYIYIYSLKLLVWHSFSIGTTYS